MRAGLVTAAKAVTAALAVVAVALAAAWSAGGIPRPPPVQPVPFSHAHHAGALGLDCRFCHSDAERGPRAGLPATEVCMSCHYPVEVRPEVPALRWVRTARLPDFTYFDHSVHVAAAVDCAACHGAVAEMAQPVPPRPFTMLWCLDCHRQRAVERARLEHCYACHR